MQQQSQFSEEAEPTVGVALVVEEQADATSEQTGLTAPLTAEEETRQEVEDWLESVGQRRPMRLDPLVFWISAAPLALSMTWIVEFCRYTEGYTNGWSLFWYWFLSFLFSLVTPLALNIRINRQRRETHEDRLAGGADVCWIGPLAEALYAPNGRQRAGAARILTRLLPQLKRSNAEWLDAQAQVEICSKLQENRSRDMEINLAILKALERFGNADALVTVTDVANGTYWRPRQRFVRRAAKQSFARMEARLKERAGQEVIASSAATEQAGEAQTLAGHPEARKSSPEIEALKLRLKEERKGRTAPGMRFPFQVAAFATILPGCLIGIGERLYNHDGLSAAAYGLIFGLTTQLPRLALSLRQSEAAKRLMAYNNVQGIGPLAEALAWPDPAIRQTAERKLTQLLPQLHASDAGLLTAAQRACLYRVLNLGNARRQEKLVCAILTALQQVGEEAAMPYVQRLADSHPRTPAQKRVQLRATECLPYLEICANQRRGSQDLLRASSMVSAPPETLLRPAVGNTLTEPQQLLRAGIEVETS